MKKSEIYKKAQLAVLGYENFTDDEKLDILRELQDKEGTALFVEDREAREAANNEENGK